MVVSVERTKVPQLWIDSLDIDPLSIGELMRNDKKLMTQFALETYQKSKRRKNKIKDKFIDIFLINLLKRKSVVIGVMNKLILDYHKNKIKPTYNYDDIMNELDEMLGLNEPKKVEIINYCNCSKKDLFCFCIDDKGNFVK